MTALATHSDLDVSDLDLWRDGPPHEIFEQLRREPLHWSELGDFPDESGFWSVVRYDDIAAVGPRPRDLLVGAQHHPRRQARAEPGAAGPDGPRART